MDLLDFFSEQIFTKNLITNMYLRAILDIDLAGDMNVLLNTPLQEYTDTVAQVLPTIA